VAHSRVRRQRSIRGHALIPIVAGLALVPVIDGALLLKDPLGFLEPSRQAEPGRLHEPVQLAIGDRSGALGAIAPAQDAWKQLGIDTEPHAPLPARG
jgi:hypothetical protein